MNAAFLRRAPEERPGQLRQAHKVVALDGDDLVALASYSFL
ncbi:hypothetical protein [Actinomadura montaniterrae]|nr:hypothetical protein [Actinomadura montaniterrae]